MPLNSETRLKTYSPPKLNKLTPEQAMLLLIGHASSGDQGAKDLLEVLYPLAEHDGNHSVPAYFEEKEPAQITSRAPRIIRRALAAFQSTKENFHRFVRG
jgi:hypothetical protein